jgi:hypothetical protein
MNLLYSLNQKFHVLLKINQLKYITFLLCTLNYIVISNFIEINLKRMIFLKPFLFSTNRNLPLLLSLSASYLRTLPTSKRLYHIPAIFKSVFRDTTN